MAVRLRRAWVVPAVICLAAAVPGCDSSSAPRAAVVHKTTVAPCRYRSAGALPDPTCTPGATNPDVTQATIGQTICVAGWTATVRPPLARTGPEKVLAIQRYGARYGGNLNAYEYDHLVPLEIGGAVDSPLNMWPEPAATVGGNGSYDKDTVENRVHGLVCSGKMTLAAAQRIFATDWRKGRR